MSIDQKQQVWDLLKSIETGEIQSIGYINPQNIFSNSGALGHY